MRVRGVPLAQVDGLCEKPASFKDSRVLSKEAEPQPVIESDYANRIDRILNLIYGFLPENGQLRQINITERKDSNFVAVNIPSFIIENNHFQSTIQIKEDTLPQQLWEATGELNRRDYTLKASVFAPEKRKISHLILPAVLEQKSLSTPYLII